MRLRVQKRYVYDSDQRGHWNYVLQQFVLSEFAVDDDDGYWDDVPVVDEDGKEADYD